MCWRSTILLTFASLFVGALHAQQAPSRPTTFAPQTGNVSSEEPDAKKPIPGVDSRYIVPPDEPSEVDFWGEIVGNDQEDELKLLRRARLKAAQDAMRASQLRFELGGIAGGEGGYCGTTEQIYKASRLVLEARLEAAETDAETLAAWEEYLPQARSWEWLTQRRSQQGLQGGGSIDIAAARAVRMEAEIHVLKLRRLVYGRR